MCAMHTSSCSYQSINIRIAIDRWFATGKKMSIQLYRNPITNPIITMAGHMQALLTFCSRLPQWHTAQVESGHENNHHAVVDNADKFKMHIILEISYLQI